MNEGELPVRARLEKPALWFVAVVVVVTVAGQPVPAGAQFNNARADRPEVTLPGGPVRQVILRSCTACHGIDDYAYNAVDRAGWQAVVETMKEKGAVISDNDQSILLDWLVAEFGPDSTAFPRNPVTPVDNSLFADDEAGRGFVETVCQSCHSLESVDIARHSEERWRAIVVDMKGRGAAVADENVEALVEYFTRTRGPNPPN